MMIQATLVNFRGASRITVSLREDTAIGMIISVIKKTDIEDTVRPASVHVYSWQGLPDGLLDLKVLTEGALLIANELDQYILTLEDFDKSWSVYQTGVAGQTWRIQEE